VHSVHHAIPPLGNSRGRFSLHRNLLTVTAVRIFYTRRNA
jgi:hypothetical protein